MGYLPYGWTTIPWADPEGEGVHGKPQVGIGFLRRSGTDHLEKQLDSAVRPSVKVYFFR